MNSTKINFLFIVLLLATFVISIINTSMSLRNQELMDNIDKCSEEKMLLRARYFSQISASNLTQEASERSMAQPAQRDIRRVLAPKQSSFIQKLSMLCNNFTTKIQIAMRRPADIVSGY